MNIGRMKASITLLLSFLIAGLASAQTSGPMRLLGADLTGSLRVRGEAWNWFDTMAGDGEYAFLGSLLRVSAARQSPRWDWQIEGAAPALLFLPDDAVAPAPQGQLGFGGSYFAANSEKNTASIFLKQAFVRFKTDSATARIGRFEFVEGMEAMPKDPGLAAIRRERVAHRIIGNFGFTHVGRSIDGAQLNWNAPAGNLTLMAGFPTQGVFDVDGGKTLDDVHIAFGSFTRPFSTQGEWRLFATSYGDDRDVVKTDNRPAAVRSADREALRIQSVGAHYLHRFDGLWSPDLLVWGNWQTGDWGTQSHDAWAAAIEGGVALPSKWNPSIRVGWFHGSGDPSPNDGKHETFFSMLPTPRIYARFPFYNTMNNEDSFVALGFRPHAKVNVRTEIHRLELSERNDLWYVGGGAFDETTFGYAGRPSNGQTSLGTLIDLGFDVAVTPTSSIGIYLARAFGSDVIERIYPDGADASLFLIEATKRF